jgi:hypothetical protein
MDFIRAVEKDCEGFENGTPAAQRDMFRGKQELTSPQSPKRRRVIESFPSRRR